MDFDHAYTLCGLIRNLQMITGTERIRFLILTHNIEFMRVLMGNEIPKNAYILKDNKLDKFSKNLALPYIYHLLDIHNISEGKNSPDHTTGNSIRHIIETLTKFEMLDSSNASLAEFIKKEFSHDDKIYTAIQDLSHGGWRSEQPPIKKEDYMNICKAVINCVYSKYEGHINFCKSCT